MRFGICCGNSSFNSAKIERSVGTNKKVVDIQFESVDGAVLFRVVYDDGSKGILESAGFDTNDPRAGAKMQRIKSARIGKEVAK